MAPDNWSGRWREGRWLPPAHRGWEPEQEEKVHKKPRERLYEIIEKGDQDDLVSWIYDRIILVMVFLSAIPLIYKQWDPWVISVDRIITSLFVVDYILRWMTADYAPQRKDWPTWWIFVRYPFTPLAVIDLLSILPVLTTFDILPDMSGGMLIQTLRLMRVFRCARLLKTMRYSRTFVYLSRALMRERKLLIMVLMLALMYVFISAAIIFSIEPMTFDTFFDALYWAAVSLTTVGYGDIYPVTDIGRGLGMASTLCGIAIVAMPTGVITAGFMEEVNRVRAKNESKLEQEVEELITEIRALRQERMERGLEDKLEMLADYVIQLSEKTGNGADIPEDLKNLLHCDTIHEQEECEQENTGVSDIAR